MGTGTAGTGLYFDFVHLVCRFSQEESQAQEAPEEFEEPLGQHTLPSRKARKSRAKGQRSL